MRKKQGFFVTLLVAMAILAGSFVFLYLFGAVFLFVVSGFEKVQAFKNIVEIDSETLAYLGFGLFVPALLTAIASRFP